MLARLGFRKPSPSSASACITIVTSVASDSASWVERRSRPRFLTKRPPISSPMQTPRLERISAASPAALLVIQNRCGVALVATRLHLSCGFQDFVAAVLEHHGAAVHEPFAREAGAAQDGGLGERLGLERRGREGRGLHDPGEGG